MNECIGADRAMGDDGVFELLVFIETGHQIAQANAAFDHIANAEFGADRRHVDRASGISLRGLPSDDAESGYSRQVACEIVRDSAGQGFLCIRVRGLHHEG